MLLTNQTKITRFLFRHKNALMSAYHHTLQHNHFHNALAVTSSFRTRKSRCFRISVTDFRINRRFGVVVKGCLDKRTFGSSSSGNDSSGFDDHSLYKGRVVCVSNPQLLRREDLKVELDEAGENGGVFKGDCLPEKVVVAVDVDEVLGNFVSALNRFIADRYSTSHSVSEYHVYEFFKIWKCSRDEADICVHEFFKSPYFKTGIYPIPGARAALNKLSRFCQLSIVTSRQNVIKDHTIEWIEKHFPGLFQEIHFGNHFALHGVSRPKSEICKSLGAKVLIDDNPRYAIECAKVGIRVLLFDYENSYPWSKSESIHEHPLVTKVHNWEEVEQQLMKWVVS